MFGYIRPTWKLLSFGSILRQDMKRFSPKPSEATALSSSVPLFVSFPASTLLLVRSKQTSDSIVNLLVSVSFTQNKSHSFQASRSYLLFSLFKSLSCFKAQNKRLSHFYPLYSPELKTIFFSICFVLADIQNTQLSHLRCPSITPRSRSQESECQRFHRKNIFILTPDAFCWTIFGGKKCNHCGKKMRWKLELMQLASSLVGGLPPTELLRRAKKRGNSKSIQDMYHHFCHLKNSWASLLPACHCWHL